MSTCLACILPVVFLLLILAAWGYAIDRTVSRRRAERRAILLRLLPAPVVPAVVPVRAEVLEFAQYTDVLLVRGSQVEWSRGQRFTDVSDAFAYCVDKGLKARDVQHWPMLPPPLPPQPETVPESHIVAVYDVDRAFGGCEEGGWWYETGKLVRIVRTFPDEDSAYAYARRLNARLRSRTFGPNRDKPSVSSVLSEGELQAWVFEGAAPDHFPERRPHYE